MAQISELELAHYSNEDIVEIPAGIKKYSVHSQVNIVPQMAGLRKEQLLNIFRYLTSSLKNVEEVEEEVEHERPSKHILLARALMEEDQESEDEEDDESSEVSLSSSSFERMMDELEYS